ncbi:MAG: 2-oxo acid dehydrogenase subunit E2 [Chitinophagaceae bacterium]|nr:2-oxo acid dehydrogenase subunit E2 [Chitinophagaceae bacterium]
MSIIDLVMPKMGESIMEATILKWNKNVGDAIQLDETLLEIATDKVDSEVPSTAAGVIAEILFKVDDVVPVGTIIAKISTGGEAVSPAPAEIKVEAPKVETPKVAPVSQPAQMTPQSTSTSGMKFYSPLVMNIAASEGIGMQELENIPGTGNEGRVTKKDILQYIQNKKSGQSTTPVSVSSEATSTVSASAAIAQAQQQSVEENKIAPSANYGGNVELIEMDRMRKLIAEHMVRSKATSPHVTSFTEADVTNMVLWRNKIKNKFVEKYNEKITFTPLFIEAIVNSIKKFPMINCSLDGNTIVLKKDLNIGMAAALPSGNLIVPVIKNADTKNLYGLTKEVNLLANNARNNKLKPEDTQNGTFTLTNVGTFGSLMGTPIINQPQVAILAVGAIKKRPMVLETPQGDVIAIRHMMYLSLSYDHRIVDGSLGAGFLTEVANQLEAFDPNREL